MHNPSVIPPRKNTGRNKLRGSTLVVVMVLSIALGIFLVALLGRGQTEQRLTDRNARLHEAYNAAESLANYGIADIGQRYVTRVYLPPNEFQSNPLEIPTNDFFDDTYIDSSYLELLGGTIPASAKRVYIDADNPANRNDPLKGSVVDLISLNVYSRASATPTLQATNPTKVFLKQEFMVRFVNLTDALFYNMDLELHPGPYMNFKGKVHANGDIWVMSGGGLDFYNTVTAAGKIWHGYKYKYQANPSDYQSGAHTNDVRFVNKSNNLVSMRINTSNTNGSWVYNRPGNPVWLEESDKRWGGMVQDVAHEVKKRNPAGIPNYVPDDPNTPANELQNHAYAIIEPLLPSGHANRKSDAGRQQKFNARACLVFRVENAVTGPNVYDGLTIRAYTWARTTSTRPINSQAPFDGTMQLDGNGDPILVPVYVPPGLIGAMNSAGAPATRTVTYYDTTLATDVNQVIRTYISNATDDRMPEAFAISGSTITRGMRDGREQVNLSPITIDIGRLRELVDPRAHPARNADKMSDFWIDPADPTHTVTFDPKTQWNGTIYVQFPTGPATTRVDNIVATRVKNLGLSGTTNLSLQIVNGHKIPNAPTENDTTVSAGDRFKNPNPGFTVATNGPLYVIGNYNSDGREATGAPDVTDTWIDAKNRTYLEPPAGIACDSFTVLSKNWIPGPQDIDGIAGRDGGGTIRHNRRLSDSNTNMTNRNSDFTELSVSVLTGLKPTKTSSGVISGGAHNFPRFLEDWSGGVKCRLRTSLNAMFESEAHTAAMPESSPGYYDPPTRDWGQPDQAANPNLVMIPPGWIQVIDFRMGGITPLNEAAYEAEVASLR